MRFTHSIPLRFSDTDVMGHVNNARYLSYLEDARVAFLIKLGDEAAFSPGLIVARIEIDFLVPIRLSVEPIVVTLWISHIGNRSFTIDYEFHHQEQLMGRAKSVIVAYNYTEGRSRDLTEKDRKALEGFLSQP